MATTQPGGSSTTQTSGNMASGRGGGTGQRTPNVTYNLVSVAYHALQGCETYEQYAQDAEQEGKQDVAMFFREVMLEDQRRADRAQQLMMQCLQQQGQGRSGQLHSQASGSAGQQGSSTAQQGGGMGQQGGAE
jgi:hypothetical protein